MDAHLCVVSITQSQPRCREYERPTTSAVIFRRVGRYGNFAKQSSQLNSVGYHVAAVFRGDGLNLRVSEKTSPTWGSAEPFQQRAQSDFPVVSAENPTTRDRLAACAMFLTAETASLLESNRMW